MRRERSSGFKAVARGMRAMRPHGFTLIELVVVMGLVGVLVASIYQFFARTSDALYEAESLAETTDRARFALEVLARDVQSAGAFGTADSGAGVGVNASDIWINTTQAAGYRVRGITQLPTHQARGASDYLVALDPTGAPTNNPGALHDSIILTGAYDFPFTFEVSNVQIAGGGAVTLANTQRGYLRFARMDAFDLRSVSSLSPARAASLTGAPRILRIMDHNGYLQFGLTGPNQPAPTAGGQVLALQSPPALQTRVGNDLWGLEPAASTDVGYDAALLDVFRYRVCRDPQDATNLKLIKERMQPSQIIMPSVMALTPPPVVCGLNDAAAVADTQVTLVERVVDFRVWYDCVPQMGVTAIPWVTQWDTSALTQIGAPQQHACALVQNNEEPGRARMAHLRLSVRTEDERRDVSHYGFLDLASGATSLTPTATTGSMQTYDIDNDPQTAARVMTFQIDVELPNFGARATSPTP